MALLVPFRFARATLLLFALALAARPLAALGLEVNNLKCEYQTNPLGIDAREPRLSWQLESKTRGDVQTAFQILVATSPKKLSPGDADLWDSDKINSSKSVHIVYRGKPLESGQRVYWKVRVWDREGKGSGFSEPAWWEMGLLSPTNWQATWISGPATKPIPDDQLYGEHPAPLLRKDFVVEKKIRRARLYVSGLGYYEARLNGERVGDHELDPGWTAYAKRVLYSTYDVTDKLKSGPNALGLMLGNGWYNPLPLKMWGQYNIRDYLTIGQPRGIAQLEVEYADGTRKTVVTDETWRATDSPITRNSVYLGEFYDARRESPGWDKPGFNDNFWKPVTRATEPLGPLVAQDAPPIRITKTLKVAKVTQPKPGVFIHDFGQNFAGEVRLRVKGKAGDRVRLRYGELLYPDGTLNGMTAVCGQIKAGGPNYRYEGEGLPKTAFQLDEYTLSGDGEEFHVPRFTFHGFRYVEVTGVPAERVTLEGLRMNSDVASAGSFECSNPLFNRIQQAVLWTELSNLFSVESDCPHREKFGYGGDIVAAGGMACFNFDMSRFYAKAVADLADDVRTNGGFTETAPFVGIVSDGLGEKAGPVGWGTAHPVLAWQLYQWYGDRRILEANYPLARRWLAFLQSCSTNGILDNGISDHESLVPKPRALTGTAFYFLNAQLVSRMADALGRTREASEAQMLAETIKLAFNRRFLLPGTGKYDTASQACQAFALYLGLAATKEKNRALEVLVKDIQENNKGHLTTGIFGTKYMLHALAEGGRTDVAYDIVNQRTFPGWGFMLEKGATTLWEHWEYSDNTYSHNHPMFGSVSEWFYRVLAGINPAPDAVGFDHVIIRPQPVKELSWAKATHDTVHGQIVCEWNRTDKEFQLHIRIPVGVVATVFLPSELHTYLTENGKPISRDKGIRLLGRGESEAIFEVDSGDYKFAARKQ